jgi:hypothetical protein
VLALSDGTRATYEVSPSGPKDVLAIAYSGSVLGLGPPPAPGSIVMTRASSLQPHAAAATQMPKIGPPKEKT